MTSSRPLWVTAGARGGTLLVFRGDRQRWRLVLTSPSCLFSFLPSFLSQLLPSSLSQLLPSDPQSIPYLVRLASRSHSHEAAAIAYAVWTCEVWRGGCLVVEGMATSNKFEVVGRWRPSGVEVVVVSVGAAA